MLRIMATATLSAICRDLGPLSSVFRWILAPLRGRIDRSNYARIFSDS
jgi:hypothetical protein